MIPDAQSLPADHAVDWLGFNRIGSPDTTPRTKIENDNDPIFGDSPPPSRSTSKAQHDAPDFMDSADLTAPSSNKRFSVLDDTPSTAADAKRISLSTGGAADKGVSEWLGGLDDGFLGKSDRKSSTLNQPGSRKGSIDFLGVGADNDSTDRPSQRLSVDKERASFLNLGPEMERGSKKLR
jgi:hypothetical protein